jgi:N6-adenosine-specific RNA methylase IME4
LAIINIKTTKKLYNGWYVDPPYQFDNKHTGGGMKSGSADHYMTMGIDHICEMPVQEHSEDNAILFLWVPTSLSSEYGTQIMKAWDFKFKGKLYWNKDKILYPDVIKYNLDNRIKEALIRKDAGWGYYFQGKVEELWFGIRGKVPAFRNRLPNVIFHPRIGHSVKPDIFRRIVEDQFSESFGKKRKMIEGFAREAKYKTKWSYFGNELD